MVKHIQSFLQKRNTHFFILLFFIFILGLTVVFGQKKQEIRQNAAGVKPFATQTVTMQFYSYSPQTLSVPAGTTVTWSNQDAVAHTTVSDVQNGADSWNSGTLNPGESFTKTFTTPGTYRFHCIIHPAMTGTIQVVDSSTFTPSPTPQSGPSPTVIIYPTLTPTPDVSTSPSPSPNPTGNSFTMQGYQYNPAFVTVPVGTTVTWSNQDAVAHTTVSDVQNGADSWNSGTLNPGESFTKTFTTPGTYRFHCIIHPAMTGYVQVMGNTSPTPSPTPDPNAANLSLTIGLHGIGTGGDNANPSSRGNSSPKHTTRTIKLTFYDLQNNQAGTGQGTVTFDSSSGLFAGTAIISNLPLGNYQIKFQADGFLQKRLTQVLFIKPGQIVTVPEVILVNGDIDNTNQLTLLDYNLLVNCYGSKQNTSSCTNPPTQQATAADLDDSGQIDAIDYNLFIRELSVQTGG